MKVAFLVPTTSHNRDWETIEETYLYKYFLRSLTLSKTTPSNYEYTVYLGVDHDDKLFNKEKLKELFKKEKLKELFKKVDLKTIYLSGIEKGHVTEIWNRLFKIAYEEGNEYFYQSGDDIYFNSKYNKRQLKWLDICIDKLKSNNNIGVTSPVCWPNNKILTQTLVSRKHMEIFGFYFPKEIKNWWCDNWLNAVYAPNHLYILKAYIIENRGGDPRYIYTEKKPENFDYLLNLGRKFLKNYLEKNQDKEKIQEKFKKNSRKIQDKIKTYINGNIYFR